MLYPFRVSAYEIASAAAEFIKQKTQIDSFEIGVVLGSGWADAAAHFGDVVIEFPLADIPGFTAPNVQGHGSVARVIAIGSNRHALVLLGRTHFYEGRGVDAVVHGVRTLAAAGVKSLVMTNACGGLNPAWSPGTPVLIKDQINFTGQTPLTGANFVDLTEIYSKRLRELCQSIEPGLAEGVYVGFTGPAYETPAEIEMVRRWGGDLVGMSTVLEAIAAREAKLEVLGISLVTNLAAGMSGAPLDHAEVLAAGKAAAERMGKLIAEVIRKA